MTRIHRRRVSAGICSITAAVLLAGPAAADSVTDQIDAGRRAYEAGDSRIAIQALQFAIAEIEQKLQQERLALLPEPLPGWTADDPAADSGGLVAMFTGTSLSRLYRSQDSAATVQLTVTADSPMLSMLGQVMASPLFAQAGGGGTPYTFRGHRGMVQQEGAGSVQITLMIGTRILLQLDGSGGADRAILERYLDAMDLDALEKALIGS